MLEVRPISSSWCFIPAFGSSLHWQGMSCSGSEGESPPYTVTQEYEAAQDAHVISDTFGSVLFWGSCFIFEGFLGVESTL